jgi:hypothetical protein
MKIEGGEEEGGLVSRRGKRWYESSYWQSFSGRHCPCKHGKVRFSVLVSGRYSAYVTTMKCTRMRYLIGTSQLNFQIDHDG